MTAGTYGSAAVTNFSYCFSYCSSLTPVVYIGSSRGSAWNYFAYSCAATGTVYVPSGSTSYTKLSSATHANAKIVTY